VGTSDDQSQATIAAMLSRVVGLDEPSEGVSAMGVFLGGRRVGRVIVRQAGVELFVVDVTGDVESLTSVATELDGALRTWARESGATQLSVRRPGPTAETRIMDFCAA
jgi:hypothetical protein